MREICDIISNATKIVTFGISSSNLAALELSTNLSKMGFNAFSSKKIHDIILTLSSFSGDEVLVVFSQTGKTAIDNILKINIEIIILFLYNYINKKNYFFVLFDIYYFSVCHLFFLIFL